MAKGKKNEPKTDKNGRTNADIAWDRVTTALVAYKNDTDKAGDVTAALRAVVEG